MKSRTKYFLIIVVFFAAIGCGAHARNSAFMSQWSNAALIHPDPTGKKWNESLTVSEDVTAVLNAQSGIFGFARIIYSDEKSVRTIYTYTDYLNVQEIRISYERTTLFVKLNGACPKVVGYRDCNVLKIYDINNRTLVETIEMESSTNSFDEVNLK